MEWNRLNKSNAEQALASAAFSSLLSTSHIVDRFSTWLLGGTGATAALMIANISEVQPFISQTGYSICGAFLILSGLSGAMAKYKAVWCQVSYQNDIQVRKLSDPIYRKHGEDEEKIRGFAKQREIHLETGFDMNQVVAEFKKPFPKWVQSRLQRFVNDAIGNQQAGYMLSARIYYQQCKYTFLQFLTFIAFVLSGFLFAALSVSA